VANRSPSLGTCTIAALVIGAALAAVRAAPATAQALRDAPPANLADVERARSRACVTTLAQLSELDIRLDPIAQRSRRLMAIAEAIAIEDRSVTSSLDPSDPVESDVRSWFSTDSLLAVRFVETGNEALQEQRSAGRRTITEQVSAAIAGARAQADSVLAENVELVQRAGPCEGAIFVRPAVVEACADAQSALCSAARDPSATSDFAFVDTPEEIWSMRVLRPWTTATPLQPGPTGLEGGRSIAYTRIGNVVLTVAFAPLLEERSEVTPAQLFQYEQTNDALALSFDHPDIAFTPGIALRAALPEPLAGEERYLLHFGDSSNPDRVWEAEAGTGGPLETSLPMTAGHVLRLRAGEPLSLTAVRGGGDEPLFTIPLSTEQQAEAISALLVYMASELNADLKRIAPPRG